MASFHKDPTNVDIDDTNSASHNANSVDTALLDVVATNVLPASPPPQPATATAVAATTNAAAVLEGMSMLEESAPLLLPPAMAAAAFPQEDSADASQQTPQPAAATAATAPEAAPPQNATTNPLHALNHVMTTTTTTDPRGRTNNGDTALTTTPETIAADSLLLAAAVTAAAAATPAEQRDTQQPHILFETHAQKKAKLDGNPIVELKRKAEKYASIQERKRPKGDEGEHHFHTTQAKQTLCEWLLSVQRHMPLCYHVDKKGLHADVPCTCLSECDLNVVADFCVKHCLATPNARDMQVRMLIQEAEERKEQFNDPQPFRLVAAASLTGNHDNNNNNGTATREVTPVRLCLDSFLNLFKIGGTKYESMKRANDEGLIGKRRDVGTVNSYRNNARRQAEPHVFAFLQSLASRHGVRTKAAAVGKEGNDDEIILLPSQYNRRNMYRDFMWEQGYQMTPGASSKRSAPVLTDFKPRTDDEWTQRHSDHNPANSVDEGDAGKTTKEPGPVCSIFCFVSIWETACPDIQIQSSKKQPLSGESDSAASVIEGREGNTTAAAVVPSRPKKKPKLRSDHCGNPYTALREAHETLLLEMQHLRERSKEEREAHQSEVEQLKHRVQYLESHLRLSSQRGGPRF